MLRLKKLRTLVLVFFTPFFSIFASDKTYTITNLSEEGFIRFKVVSGDRPELDKFFFMKCRDEANCEPIGHASYLTRLELINLKQYHRNAFMLTTTVDSALIVSGALGLGFYLYKLDGMERARKLSALMKKQEEAKKKLTAQEVIDALPLMEQRDLELISDAVKSEQEIREQESVDMEKSLVMRDFADMDEEDIDSAVER